MKTIRNLKLDSDRLIELIHSIPNTKTMVIGDLMLDEFIWGNVSRISPEAPVPVVNVTKDSYALGGAANVVNNIRALHGQVYVAGVVGMDDIGKQVFQEFKNVGARPVGVIADKSRITTLKTRVVAHHQQVVRIDRETVGEVSESVRKKLISAIETHLPHCDAVIIEDYGKGVIVPETLKYIRNLTRKYKKLVSVDPKMNHFTHYKGVHVITPNHHEAGYFVGIEIKDNKTLLQAGKKLLKLLDGGSVLITREEGMSLFEPHGEVTHIPTKAREVFDVSGAGDTVIGTLTAVMAAGGTLKEAAVISNYAAGVVVGKVGVATCSPEELINALYK